MALRGQRARQGPQLPLFGMPLEWPLPQSISGVDLLALAPIVARQAQEQGAAIIVMGDWRELQILQRALQPWHDCLITKPSGWAQTRCAEWASKPDGMLFCTPSVMAEYWRLFPAINTEIRVLVLTATAEATAALDLLGHAKPLLSVVRREFAVRCWMPVTARGSTTVEVVYPLQGRPVG